jgi:hypothetical protein
MSKTVIDVSAYNGVIDWKKVKAAGVEGAILKVIRRDLNPDKQFVSNWNGCEAVDMPLAGVYNYSYATTAAKARTDAQKVLSILNGRKAKVWMDVEDACLKGKGKTLIGYAGIHHVGNHLPGRVHLSAVMCPCLDFYAVMRHGFQFFAIYNNSHASTPITLLIL